MHYYNNSFTGEAPVTYSMPIATGNGYTTQYRVTAWLCNGSTAAISLTKACWCERTNNAYRVDLGTWSTLVEVILGDGEKTIPEEVAERACEDARINHRKRFDTRELYRRIEREVGAWLRSEPWPWE